MMLYWRFAWRELRQRPSRPILTLLSIVIGVGAVVAVTISAGTAHRAFDQIYKTVAGRAALEVSAPIGTSFDERVVEKIREVPGVKAVAPIMQRLTKLEVAREGEKPKRYTITAIGVDPTVDREVHNYDITAGNPLPKSKDEPSGVLLEANFAKHQGIKVGDTVTFSSRQAGYVQTTVIGLYSSNDIATGGAGAPMYLPLAAVQGYWHNPGLIDSAQVKTDPDVDEKKVEQAIAKILPKGVSVQPPPTRSAMAEETSLSTEQGMRMARAFSLLVAVFIITNTFLINVTQRRKQIGIMRAIGATRSQIAGMMYREALLMGVVGTILGSLLGIMAAHFLTIAMGTLYQSELPPIQPASLSLPGRRGLRPRHFAGGGGVSSAKSEPLVTAGGNARRIARGDRGRPLVVDWLRRDALFCLHLGNGVQHSRLPRYAIHRVGGDRSAGRLRAADAGRAEDGISIRRVFPAAFFPRRRQTVRRQLLRHRSRTTLTVGVVFIAAATGVGLANSVMDTVNNVRSWYHKAIVADFFVRAGEPSMATGLAPDVPDGVGDEIKGVPGIKSIDATRLGSVKVSGEVATLVARDHTEPGVPDLQIASGDPNSLRENFKNGAVALGSVLAQRTKLKVGDNLKLETDKGEKSFPVAAIVNDYQSGGLTIHMERAVARLELGYKGITGYIIKADHDKLAEVRKQLQEIADKNGILLETSADIRARIDRMMSGVVASLWAMVVLLLLVSAVGVTNTLTINVLEQTRELGLLRIVAMTQNQVRKTIFTQAVVMALLSLVPGIVAGVTIAYLINVAMMPVIGHAVEFAVHPELLLGGLLAGMAVVAFAAWFPADRAARLDLLEALRTL